MSQKQRIAQLLRQQAALAAFGTYAFRETVLENILAEAARVCAEGLGVPFCKICRYREVENDLLIEAGFGWKSGVVGRIVSKADETSPQGRAYVTGLPVILRNLRESNDVILPNFYGDHGIVSTIDVIIRGLSGEPYGVLEIDSPVFHIYDQHDVNFLTGFANVLAEAVATVERLKALHEAIAVSAALVAEKDRLLEERVMLAQELSHRVRNNLHLVQGMLETHLRSATRPDEHASVTAIIRRMMTLSEVYEQLLGTGLNGTIELGSYLQALCEKLPSLELAKGGNVAIGCSVESVFVRLDTVTAVGMAVAELVSNCIEHAFTGDIGRIDVTLRRSQHADMAVLIVADDGSGFIEQPATKRHGIGLVRRLMQQVKGTATVQSGLGTIWTLRFPIEPVGFTDLQPMAA